MYSYLSRCKGADLLWPSSFMFSELNAPFQYEYADKGFMVTFSDAKGAIRHIHHKFTYWLQTRWCWNLVRERYDVLCNPMSRRTVGEAQYISWRRCRRIMAREDFIIIVGLLMYEYVHICQIFKEKLIFSVSKNKGALAVSFQPSDIYVVSYTAMLGWNWLKDTKRLWLIEYLRVGSDRVSRAVRATSESKSIKERSGRHCVSPTVYSPSISNVMRIIHMTPRWNTLDTTFLFKKGFQVTNAKKMLVFLVQSMYHLRSEEKQD